MTLVILYRGKCNLSKCITRYLVAMASADLMVIILDLILKHIPIVFYKTFEGFRDIGMCNIHAVLLYATTDCSVWFTVAFTFDRFVVICCQKLKTKHCTERTAALVIGALTALFCAKNTLWYFQFTGRYIFMRVPWLCVMKYSALFSPVWAAIEFLHYVLTPCIPFILILVFNALTVRHILVTIRTRKRLRHQVTRERQNDPEAKSRKQSIVLLFLISGNFLVLWSLFVVSSMHSRIILLETTSDEEMSPIVKELGFMLQLLSCCTNTFVYAVTQRKFREEIKNGVKYPITSLKWTMY
ncbi:compound eye opsin BCRH2-like [Narcine bancroftii]|uniref:compound eye opsin BCRH2-like n=1 Tax=Narcine bancroftii TaxID=1343680 RepID=UPI0038310518